MKRSDPRIHEEITHAVCELLQSFQDQTPELFKLRERARRHKRLQIFVCGDTNSGKSTLVNNLVSFRVPLAPVKSVACTCQTTRFEVQENSSEALEFCTMEGQVLQAHPKSATADEIKKSLSRFMSRESEETTNLRVLIPAEYDSLLWQASIIDTPGWCEEEFRAKLHNVAELQEQAVLICTIPLFKGNVASILHHLEPYRDAQVWFVLTGLDQFYMQMEDASSPDSDPSKLLEQVSEAVKTSFVDRLKSFFGKQKTRIFVYSCSKPRFVAWDPIRETCVDPASCQWTAPGLPRDFFEAIDDAIASWKLWQPYRILESLHDIMQDVWRIICASLSTTDEQNLRNHEASVDEMFAIARRTFEQSVNSYDLEPDLRDWTTVTRTWREKEWRSVAVGSIQASLHRILLAKAVGALRAAFIPQSLVKNVRMEGVALRQGRLTNSMALPLISTATGVAAIAGGVATVSSGAATTGIASSVFASTAASINGAVVGGVSAAVISPVVLITVGAVMLIVGVASLSGVAWDQTKAKQELIDAILSNVPQHRATWMALFDRDCDQLKREMKSQYMQKMRQRSSEEKMGAWMKISSWRPILERYQKIEDQLAAFPLLY